MAVEYPGIYYDSGTCSGYFQRLEIQTLEFQTTHQQIAVFHVPFPAETTWLNRLRERLPSADRVIVFCSELHASTVHQLIELDLPKIELFVNGIIHYDFRHAKVRRWLDWFHYSSDFYRQRPDVLDVLTPYTVKPKCFDILLGCQRPNRDLVWNYIQEKGLADQNLMTYHRRWNIDLRKSDQFIPEEAGVEYIETPEHTVHQVRYYGYRMCLSQVVPLQIYNQTAYTLVTETNGVNDWNFYTEKIVKPILAKRLFVAISGKHYLKNLRAMGFRTFDGLIDESYDEVEDDYTRYNLALEQVLQLCNRPQTEILAGARSVVEHNYQVMTSTDWNLIDYPQETI